MVAIQHDSFTLTKIINSFKRSNTFVIEPVGDNCIWLVDIGDADKVLNMTGTRSIAGIFITHAHLDHIYGLEKILSLFPDCLVCGSTKCLSNLLDDKKNLSFYYERPLCLSLPHVHQLEDNEEFKLCDTLSIGCFHTPGHTDDSACFSLNNILFTGDAYIPGLQTVTKLRGGDKVLSKKSRALIKSKIKPDTIICPGHTVE